MLIIRDPKKIASITQKIKLAKNSIGFVPTMGALHLGHESLIKQARLENKILVVSIFVNPLQFGQGEDLKKYPRPLKLDLKLCQKLGVDFVFIPHPAQIYPHDYATAVELYGLSNMLCGLQRPGHFRGVATVVAKLLNLISPDMLYLGQKDAQQAVIISRMIKDLNFPVRIKVLPTVRASDGLALSSRNIYLSKQERLDATVLFKALCFAKTLIKGGQRNSALIIKRMRELILKKKTVKIEYVAIVNSQTLKPQIKIASGVLIALAVRIGKTRLIDNLLIKKC